MQMRLLVAVVVVADGGVGPLASRYRHLIRRHSGGIALFLKKVDSRWKSHTRPRYTSRSRSRPKRLSRLSLSNKSLDSQKRSAPLVGAFLLLALPPEDNGKPYDKDEED